LEEINGDLLEAELTAWTVAALTGQIPAPEPGQAIASEKPTFRYKSSLDECIGDYALIDDAHEIVTPMNCG
jgi:hypothetical protein